MGISPKDYEDQADMVGDRVQGGLDVLEEYAGPLLDRYGRTALIVGVTIVAAVGVALIVSRRRSRTTPLTRRIQDAIPDSVGARLERPMASLRERIGR